ncbi:AlpA family phage regulatory protein [Erythrobacter sp. NFXS35]|uniref:helix-turn-helix transcriptional regulator n=1 Tax=Erythrobacter sp. NFXS35 TaxID=2818436 RepID=UPI0032DE2CD5
MTLITPWSPYLEQALTTSAGRIALVKAFGDLVCVQQGFHEHELPEIFAAPEDEGENDACRHLVTMDAAFLTTQFVRERIATFARPLGGGEVVPIVASMWEIDDPLPRMATGAFNLHDWANHEAPLTHRIFVDSADFDEWLAGLISPARLSNRELEAALDPQLRAARAVAARRVKTALEPQGQSFEGDAGVSFSQSLSVGDELLTRPEVEALVKLGRSAIYAKIKDDGFPDNIMLGGRAVWRKSEVMAWVEEKAAQGRRSIS